ncbi:unnamed protein product [Durusdinium trenchii]|uniref:Uncharacterized protein n=1 Tax=Durusdinium trenchii TaxID=1381693 RepID=A0ABP0N6A5_9DINO
MRFLRGRSSPGSHAAVGGRNRKRGSRKDFEKSDAQPPQLGTLLLESRLAKEKPWASTAPGPSPCDSPPNAKPSPTTMVRAAMPMQMPLMHMAYPRLQPMYGGLPVFFPKAPLSHRIARKTVNNGHDYHRPFCRSAETSAVASDIE